MSSDLVHAAGDGIAGEEGKFRPCSLRRYVFQYLEERAAGATCRMTCLTHADAGGGNCVHGRQGFCATGAFPGRLSFYNGQVTFADEAALHSAAQFTCCSGVFCDEYETACFAIQAIDERDASAAGYLVGEQLGHAAEQSGFLAAHATGGVHDEWSCFVHDQNVSVFVDYRKLRTYGDGKITAHQ